MDYTTVKPRLIRQAEGPCFVYASRVTQRKESSTATDPIGLAGLPRQRSGWLIPPGQRSGHLDALVPSENVNRRLV